MFYLVLSESINFKVNSIRPSFDSSTYWIYYRYKISVIWGEMRAVQCWSRVCITLFDLSHELIVMGLLGFTIANALISLVSTFPLLVSSRILAGLSVISMFLETKHLNTTE